MKNKPIVKWYAKYFPNKVHPEFGLGGEDHLWQEQMPWDLKTPQFVTFSLKVAEFPKLALKHGILLNLPI